MDQNKQFLEYPIIKPLDLMISRIILEIFSSFIIVVATIITFICLGIDVMPRDAVQAIFGLLSAVLLGLGFGIFNGVITMILPIWNIVYVLFLIVFWLTAGVANNPENLPIEVGRWFAWNPLLHCIEWVRGSYYLDYPTRLLDKSYVLSIGFGSLGLGLLMDRFLQKYTRKR
jgi:capsular polysaccharide transport system permease protein